MKKNKVWVVPIDFSPIDKVVIGYTKYLAALQSPEKVLFVNVVKEFKPSFFSEFQGFQEQILVDQKLRLENKVDTHFKDAGVPYECHIISGTPFEEVIGLVLNKSGSLVILGRKKISSGSGIVSDRLSRNLPCDMLLVPEGFEPKLNKVLVTTDFSEHADLAMAEALELLNKEEDEKEVIELFAHHSYSVPPEYSKLGKTEEEFAETMRLNAEKEMSKWLRKYDSDISPILTLQEGSSFAKQVIDQVEKQEIDLIVMGSKGQTVASLALLGSNTMKVLKADPQVPVWIAKKPGENMSFINAIRKT
ncbi:MAG: universal stress protein [Cyclobacteriaceae bacterium]